MSTQLYDNTGVMIYPTTKASSVTTNFGDSGNVEAALTKLASLVGDSTGDKETATTISIEIEYTKSLGNTLDSLTGLTWNSSFQSPTEDFPYAWKKTVIKVAEIEQGTFYEIVASNIQDKTQTIYKATSGADSPTLDLEKTEDGENDIDKMNYDEYVPDGWKTTPISVSASNPNVWMATRNKVQGNWGVFEGPYQFGRWAFDSTVTFMFHITDDSIAPFADRSETNPNVVDSAWTEAITEEFTGYLWMISATKVNGVLLKVDNYIWSQPSLITIVK